MLRLTGVAFAETGRFDAFTPEADFKSHGETLKTVVLKHDEKPAHKIILRCVLAAMALLCVHSLAWSQTCEATLAKLRSGERPLVAGGVSEFAPFNVVASDGRLTGMDREIIRAIAGRLGIKKVEFKSMPFSRLGPALLDGTIDVIANNFWITPERERSFAFTTPYYVRGGVGSLWLTGTGPFDSAASMAGKRIAAINGGWPERWVQENVPMATTVIVVDGTISEQNDALKNKQADVVVGFYTQEMAVAIAKVSGLVYHAHLLKPMQAAFAMRKECGELRQAIDDTVKAMWADGSLFKIKNVWLEPLGIVPATKR